MLSFAFTETYGQSKYEKCKVEDKELKRVKYYIGYTERSIPQNDQPSNFIVDISVKPNKINEKDLLLIARHLKQKFCKEDYLIVGIFDRKDVAENYRFNVQEARNHLRGEYFLNRITGEEYISFVLIPDYNGNPQARIKIDLSSKTTTKKFDFN